MKPEFLSAETPVSLLRNSSFTPMELSVVLCESHYCIRLKSYAFCHGLAELMLYLYPYTKRPIVVWQTFSDDMSG